jgi:uncharacterized membrane protein YqiK
MGLFIILIILAVLSIGAVVLSLLYVKTPANMAFVRTGLRGKKVVIDRGAVVWPVVQHIQWLSLETMKLEVFKEKKEAFITKDRFRVDIGAEFYVKIEPMEESIEKASRSLGERSFSPEGIKALLEEKLISSLRTEAAKRTLVELHENRHDFTRSVMANLKEVIQPNGLTLEDVSLFYLDQTDRNQLDPNNIFDAEGLRQITAQTSERMRERNEIERNTEVAIKKKDVEAVKLKLALDQERNFAETEQIRQIETDKAKKMAEIEQFKFNQERLAREAEIAKERGVREAELKKETALVQIGQMKELAEIEKSKAVEEANRLKEIAVILKEIEKIKEEKKRLETQAVVEEAAQLVITSQERAKAEREKEIASIAALKELDVAEKKAKITETLAQARKIEGDAEAYAMTKLKEAENILDEKIIRRDISLGLIQKSPDILRELMVPAKAIESIRVIHVDGLGGDTNSPSGVDSVVGAFLRAGAAMPLLRELLDFSKVDPETLQKVVSQFPGLKDLVKKKE